MADFNFDSYNLLVNNVPTGLKLHLAMQLLRDVEYAMGNFGHTELEDAIANINRELRKTRIAYKRQAEIAMAKRDKQDRQGPATIEPKQESKLSDIDLNQ